MGRKRGQNLCWQIGYGVNGEYFCLSFKQYFPEEEDWGSLGRERKLKMENETGLVP